LRSRGVECLLRVGYGRPREGAPDHEAPFDHTSRSDTRVSAAPKKRPFPVVGAVDPDHVHHKVTLLCAEAGVDKAAAAVVTSAVNAFVLVIMRD
jgi:hypothetical protein